MTDIRDRIQEIESEADSAIKAEEEMRAAEYERNEEFPQSYVKMFHVFLDFGPFLYRDFFNGDGWEQFDPAQVPPSIFRRFLRALVLSYGLLESPRSPERLENELTAYFELLDTRVSEWTATPQKTVPKSHEEPEYIRRTSEIRVLLHQLAEFEFLGEHNWEFWMYPPFQNGDQVIVKCRFNDLNPLDIDPTIDHLDVTLKYHDGVDIEYKDFRGNLSSYPPISDIVGANVRTSEGNCELVELEMYVKRLRERLTAVRGKLDEMSQRERDRYFAHCYLRLLYLKRGCEWAESDLPEDIGTAVIERQFSDRLYTSKPLYALRYFHALRDGAEALLEDLQGGT